jgi:hypothetical protein
VASKPLTVIEQKALARTMSDPQWAKRAWNEAAVEEWRRSQAYIDAVHAIESFDERMNRELAAFERRQIEERAAFMNAQKRAMDGAR